MCRAYYSNCRGVATNIPCKEQVYIFDWKPCGKARARSVCEPTFHPDPAGDLGQCEECERMERQLNPGHLVDKSSIYQIHCPRREPPPYAPPPYVAPRQYFKSSVSSVARPARAARASTHLQLPPMPQYVESPYADGSARRRNTTAINCTTMQQQPSTSSRSLHSSAANNSLNIRAAEATTTIDASSLLRPPAMPTFLESPYVCTRDVVTSTDNEQQPLQNLPPVAQAINCRRLDDYCFEEGESTLEPRVLGLRSQWYENKLLEPQKPSPWKSLSSWMRKAGEKMTGQGRPHQRATQLPRSEQLARQPRVKPQRDGIATWVAASSNLDHGGQPIAWTY